MLASATASVRAGVASLRHKSATVVGAALDMLPPDGAELSFNLLLHTFVFFVVLTVLYQAVISPMEARALAGQVEQAVGAGVGAALQGVTPAQAQALRGLLPTLRTLQKLSPDEDPVRVLHNQGVIASAWVLAGSLGLAFFVAACVMGAARMRLGGTMAHVFAENAILLVILGAIEGGFFMTIARKYVPVMPSVLANTTVEALKANFPAQPSP